MRQQHVEQGEMARLMVEAGVSVPESVLASLSIYLDMLCRWNAVMNLVGHYSWQKILTDLVLDSFFLAEFLESLGLPPSPLCWDLGAGAGLPGIPLRMVWTRGMYSMVEAREKRALFLSSVIARLQLQGTGVFRGSVENFFRSQACLAECILSRAFLPWRQMLDVVQGHIRPGGILVILSREPAPRNLPQPWQLLRHMPYTAGGVQRHFWALSSEKIVP
ncbi:MAG: class I SAM-dependent methyltransferase [Desulfovibrio sp.]|nr:class I SAM-dependent methyltransferase [Desulfovibrio sp.]